MTFLNNLLVSEEAVIKFIDEYHQNIKINKPEIIVKNLIETETRKFVFGFPEKCDTKK